MFLPFGVGNVAIGKPEREAGKASHWLQATIILIACSRHVYICVLFFTHIPFVVNRTLNANGEVATVKRNFATTDSRPGKIQSTSDPPWKNFSHANAPRTELNPYVRSC